MSTRRTFLKGLAAVVAAALPVTRAMAAVPVKTRTIVRPVTYTFRYEMVPVACTVAISWKNSAGETVHSSVHKLEAESHWYVDDVRVTKTEFEERMTLESVKVGEAEYL